MSGIGTPFLQQAAVIDIIEERNTNKFNLHVKWWRIERHFSFHGKEVPQVGKQLPPGQFETETWPILHQGDVYQFDEESWNFRLFGRVKNEVTLSFKEIMNLPKTVSTVDMHCVTTWSKFNTTFEGIALKELLKFVEINEDVTHIQIYGYYNGDRFGYNANLPLKDLLGDDALFVYRWKDESHDWQELSPKHGYPLRFIPPASFYLWKGTKWVSGIRFMNVNVAGFWEQLGYSMSANPFKEERYS